jgi:hypothetical protein
VYRFGPVPFDTLAEVLSGVVEGRHDADEGCSLINASTAEAAIPLAAGQRPAPA